MGIDLKTLMHIGLPAALRERYSPFPTLLSKARSTVLVQMQPQVRLLLMNFEFYTYFFVNAFSQAAVTFIGQNYAAGQYERCDKVMKFCMAASFVSTLALSLLFTLGGDLFLGIFTAEARSTFVCLYSLVACGAV